MDDAGSTPVAGTDAYNAYMRTYLRRRYAERRSWAIAQLGGVCCRCGSTEDLELDHINRSEKLFEVSLAVYKRRLDDPELLAELRKCQVLCTRCHTKKSVAERSVEHGGGLSGKRNCKCELCRAKMRQYMTAKGYNNNANRCRKRNCSCAKRHYAP